MQRIIRNIILVAIVIGTSISSGLAQFQDPNDVPKTNSPYSRLGLGDLSPLGYGTIESFGGLFASFRDPYSANIINPASLPSLAEASFEVGIYARNSGFSQGNIQESTWTGNIDYIGLAFPTKNLLNVAIDQKVPDIKHGMSISLSPYSLVGYDILDNSVIIDGNQVSDSFQGKGGTYRFMWGNGIAYKDLSVGVNIGYLFGNIEQQRSLIIPEVDFGFANVIYQRLNIRGFQWNAGAQYSLKLKTKEEKTTGEKKVKNELVFGVYGNSATDSKIFTDEVISRGRPLNGEFVEVDTISSAIQSESIGSLPSEFGFGASYYKTDPRTNFAKFKIGVNYSTTGWSNFVLGNRDANLADGWTASIGAEWLPFANAIKYRQKIRYRVGLKFGEDPREIRREQLKQAALTFGLGLSLILRDRGVSLINLSFEIGKINSNNSIDETYGRIGVGFTLNNSRWFLKRKIN